MKNIDDQQWTLNSEDFDETEPKDYDWAPLFANEITIRYEDRAGMVTHHLPSAYSDTYTLYARISFAHLNNKSIEENLTFETAQQAQDAFVRVTQEAWQESQKQFKIEHIELQNLYLYYRQAFEELNTYSDTYSPKTKLSHRERLTINAVLSTMANSILELGHNLYDTPQTKLKRSDVKELADQVAEMLGLVKVQPKDVERKVKKLPKLLISREEVNAATAATYDQATHTITMHTPQ